jgi:hypothetical protein
MKTGALMKRYMFMLIAIVVAVLVLGGGWTALYPSSSDPKNMRYVLWKAGLFKLNTDVAAVAMVADPGRDKLVVGRTKAQLRERFGPLFSISEVTPHLRECYQKSPWTGRDVLFVGRTPWMVVFDGAKATNLVLVKGS